MLRKILYTLLTLGALAWIGYASLDLIATKDKYQPNQLFGPQDGRILIINEPSEVQLEQLDFQFSEKLKGVATQLISATFPFQRLYFSENQSHFCIEIDDYWDQNLVDQLMVSLGGTFEPNGMRQFIWDGFEVSYSKQIMDFKLPETLIADHQSKWSSFDKNASYSIISFQDQSAEISDYYVKPLVTNKYTRIPTNWTGSQAINDEAWFSRYLPDGLTSYHFQERNLGMEKNPILKNHPLVKWMNSGWIQAKMGKSTFYLIDLLPSFNFRDVLSDDRKLEEDGTFEMVDIETGEKSTFHFRQIDEFVLIAKSDALLNEIDANIKLENTLSSNSSLRQSIFGGQAQQVLERIWQKDLRSTSTIYSGYLVSNEQRGRNQVKNTQDPENLQLKAKSVSFAADGTILDFAVHPSKNSFVLVNDKNEILYYNEAGEKTIVARVNSPFVGKINWIQEGKMENHALISFQSEVYLMNERGELLPNFPIQSDDYLQSSASYGNIRGQEFIAFPLQKGGYQTYSTKGKRLQRNEKGIVADYPIPTWVSQRAVYFGLVSNSQFVMYDQKRNREYRNFALNGPVIPYVLSNQIIFWSLQNNEIVYTDQKGSVYKSNQKAEKLINYRPYSNYFAAFNEGQIQILSMANGQVLHALKGIEKDDLESLDFFQMGDRKLTACVNGITNKIRYFTNGNEEVNYLYKGSKKVQLQRKNATEIYLYTILDQYIVRYELLKN